MDMMTMVQRLVPVYGISGREAAVAEEIRRMAEPYADEIWTDRLGNLICHKKGEGPKVMFAAHLDSIGLIVTHIESAGFLRVAKIGGVRPEKILHSLVQFENGTIGTIASSLQRDGSWKAVHRGSLCGYRCGEPGRGGEKGVCGRCCRLYGAAGTDRHHTVFSLSG